jgi:hypothetical protein
MRLHQRSECPLVLYQGLMKAPDKQFIALALAESARGVYVATAEAVETVPEVTARRDFKQVTAARRALPGLKARVVESVVN